MKKHLLSLLALCLMGVSGVQAQSEVSLAGKSAECPSVAKVPVSARAPKPDASRTCNPASSDPAIIAGSWRAVDNSALLLTEDGKATVSGNSAVTDFEYFPYRGDLVLLNADGAVVQNYHVLRLSKDYLVFRLVGGSYAVYYPSDRFATSLTMSDTDVVIWKGKTQKLSIEPSPSESILPTLVWTSSNEEVASVSADGVVTAVATGTCTITAGTGDGTLNASCSVVVKDYEYVDLGLPSGTLWATCNVGASSPEDYGDYFAWGETTTKSSYTWDNYFDSEGGSPAFFYTFYHGTRNDKLGLTELGDTYDAAYTNWCANWHMPTAEQASELFAKCTWKWNKEKLGYDVVGPNGNAIFLPTAGYYDGASCSESTQKGYFWTRSLTPVYSGYADIITIASNQHEKRSATRNWGLPIRPVYEKAKDTTPSMNASELTLHVGDTHLLKVTSPLYDIPSNSINWTSSNSGVASVSQFGLVTALKPGTCTITASAKGGGWSLTCDIVVKDQVNKTFTVNGVNFDMKLVEAGTFQMGGNGEYDGKPVHSVTISKDYYIGETEVTQGLWSAVMGLKPTTDVDKQWKSQYGLGDNYPAYYISWNDCQEFITKLNEFTGQTFRMPTEAEWEFAARGGNMSQGYTYSGSNTIDEVAWYDVICYNKGEESPDYGTHPVATKKANELGLYDMSGNVWECCNDWYDDYGNTAVTDPAGATSGSSRVIRGGSWSFFAAGCRTAYRNLISPTLRDSYLGVRLALSPSKE